MGLKNICTRTFKHHNGGNSISLCNYETVKGVLVQCRAPSLRPGGGKGVIVLVVSEPRFRRYQKTY